MNNNRQGRTVMEVIALDSKSGWGWIKDGMTLIGKNPWVWIALFFAYLLISLSLYLLLPLIGLIMFYLIDPLFVAGFMIGCKELDAGRKLEVAHLFSAFKHNASRLVTLGCINLIGRIIIFGAMGLFFVNSGYDFYWDQIAQGNYELLLSALFEAKVLVWLLVSIALLLPLYMIYWFSPALVEFDEVEPFEAVSLSFKGCVENAKAFAFYGLTFLVVIAAFFLTVAVIGATLGWASLLIGGGVLMKVIVGYIGLVLALLCWIGVQVLMAASQYMSYKTIFQSQEETNGMLAL